MMWVDKIWSKANLKNIMYFADDDQLSVRKREREGEREGEKN